MALQATLTITATADTVVDLDAAVSYLTGRVEVLSVNADREGLTLTAQTVPLPWDARALVGG